MAEKSLKTYQMKDLGYKRTPTDAALVVQMPDLSWWKVPVQAIADSRDEHYADEEEDTVGFIRSGHLDDYEIKDWAAGNMNWSDVEQFAVKEKVAAAPVDFQEGWTNGEKSIKGKI